MKENTWVKWYDKLNNCTHLKEGWDSYTADPPSKRSFENAMTFVGIMEKYNWEPTRMEPSVVGGIAITRRENNRKVFIEFYNHGSIWALFCYEDSLLMETMQLDMDHLSIENFLVRADAFLKNVG